jgi:hypothetical protein
VHTVKVLAGGFALLVLCLVVGRANGAGCSCRSGFSRPASAHVVCVSRAGYSVAEETRLSYVFAIPAAVALLAPGGSATAGRRAPPRSACLGSMAGRDAER